MTKPVSAAVASPTVTRSRRQPPLGMSEDVPERSHPSEVGYLCRNSRIDSAQFCWMHPRISNCGSAAERSHLSALQSEKLSARGKNRDQNRRVTRTHRSAA